MNQGKAMQTINLMMVLMLLMCTIQTSSATFRRCYAGCMITCVVIHRNLPRCAAKCLGKCIINSGGSTLLDYCKLGCAANECAQFGMGKFPFFHFQFLLSFLKIKFPFFFFFALSRF